MGALGLADVGEGWPVIETFEWEFTTDSYALDALRRRWKKAREGEKRLGSWRVLMLT